MTGLRGKRRHHGPGVQVQLVEQEVVGVNDGDAPRLNPIPRKALQVEGDDGVSVGTDRRGEDVAILRIDLQPRDQRLVVLGRGVRECFGHLGQSVPNTTYADPLARYGSRDFIQDVRGPTNPVGAQLADTKHRVGERGRNEDAGVQQDDEHSARFRRTLAAYPDVQAPKATHLRNALRPILISGT